MSKTLALNSKEHWSTFSRMKQLISCRSTDPDRPSLHRILIESTGKRSKAIATNGHTLRVDRIHKPMVPGIYDVTIDRAEELKLERVGDEGRFPHYKQCITVIKKNDYHVLERCGPVFISRISANLATYVDLKIIKVHRDEHVELYVPKNSESGVIARNSQTLIVMMPIPILPNWVQKLAEIRQLQSA